MWWSTLASILLGGLLGVLGWVIPELVVKPGKEIFDLRREAQECMIVYGDLSKDAPDDEGRAAAKAFRRIGSGLVSRHTAAQRWVNWWCKHYQGWDINSAGFLLIDLANYTKSDPSSRSRLESHVGHIRRYLKLAPPQEPEHSRLISSTAQGQPREFDQ
jgi:hypothetical protein